ncbi:MAG: hypothetical protein ACFFBP_04135 [Promethearchaeota archaeon]
MPRERKPRKAPLRKVDPLDEYSTWDVRVARTFYYATIIATAVVVLGIWGTILGMLIESKKLEIFLGFPLALQAAIISAAVTGHLILLVFFYTLFRGGIYRLCKVLFPDRKIAKKYEDYNTLRWLIAITLIGAFVTITFIIIFILPKEFYSWAWGIWVNWMYTFSAGVWILWFGAMMFLFILFFFIIFLIWSHGVFAVLKRVKRIEEEIEIEEEIKVDKLKGMNEEELHKAYHKETGKNAIYRGKETRSYKNWKKNRVG